LGRDFGPLSPFFQAFESGVSVSVIKNGKNGKQEFEGPRLERYENQKVMGSKGHALPLFRGISGERPAPSNFCAFARIFRNPVTGNTFRSVRSNPL
jgi:hypothetical protein